MRPSSWRPCESPRLALVFLLGVVLVESERGMRKDKDGGGGGGGGRMFIPHEGFQERVYAQVQEKYGGRE